MTDDASPHIDKNKNVLHKDGSYRRRDGRVTFWKPTHRFGKGSEFPKLVAPNGYDTVPGFAKRHGLAKNLPYIYIREPVYPIPHLYDEPTGRTYIHKKKGDEWLARVQNDPTTYARMRTLAKNVKAMERLAAQLEMARYEESHDLCLKMVEAFKRETGYDNLLRQRMGEESQSGQETS